MKIDKDRRNKGKEISMIEIIESKTGQDIDFFFPFHKGRVLCADTRASHKQ